MPAAGMLAPLAALTVEVLLGLVSALVSTFEGH